jgi:hypothetical protein
MAIDSGNNFRGSIECDGKSDGKNIDDSLQPFINQQLRTLVDDRVGATF